MNTIIDEWESCGFTVRETLEGFEVGTYKAHRSEWSNKTVNDFIVVYQCLTKSGAARYILNSIDSWDPNK